METTAVPKILNVGDVIYEYGNYGIAAKHTVASCTPKRVTLDNGYVLNRELYSVGVHYRTSRIGAPEWERGLRSYILEDEVLIKEWFRKEALDKLKGFSFASLTTDELEAIMKIITH